MLTGGCTILITLGYYYKIEWHERHINLPEQIGQNERQDIWGCSWIRWRAGELTNDMWGCHKPRQTRGSS